MGDTFKYFAYGSNLLQERMHHNNPSARRYGIGLLTRYRLDFGGHFSAGRWKGYVATIVPDAPEEVWGAIWDVGTEHLESLDQQEGVHLKIYEPIEVQVTTPSGEGVTCRSYCLVKSLGSKKGAGLPTELPSKAYMNTIIRGAKESNLPAHYIRALESIPDNGFSGPVNLSLARN